MDGKVIIRRGRKKTNKKKNSDENHYQQLDKEQLFLEATKLINRTKNKRKDDPEILEIENKLAIIKKIIEEKEIIYGRKSSSSTKSGSQDFSYYPNISDKMFNKKIYHKKEFYENRIKNQNKDIDQLSKERCNPSKFELMPNQIFLKNFISLDTPYNGLLIWHGTGVGKTCSAITIAEQFKDIIKREGKKMFVLLSPSIKDNFKKQIFNSDKLGRINFEKISDLSKRDLPQCTGKNYMKELDDIIIEDNEYLNKKINRIINSYYNFMGYDSFANYVTKLEEEYVKGYEESKKEIIKKNMRKELFSNTVIIIDEAHHIRINGENSKKIAPPVIERVIRDAENVKLILLTATPMYNSHTEIVWLLNLLLQNDNKPKIKENQIFEKSGTLIPPSKDNPGGLEILKHKARGYISYLRGENPYSFPFRLYPSINKDRSILNSHNIPIKNMMGNLITEENKIKYLQLIESNMQDIQYKVYRDLVKSLMKNEYDYEESSNESGYERKRDSGYSEIERGLQISNIVYPNSEILNQDIEPNKFYGHKGFEKTFDTVCSDSGKKYKYNDNVYEKFGKILQCPNSKKGETKEGGYELNDFSSKMSSIIDYIYNSEGIVYIYSQFIVSGVLPLALALEQNGFRKYGKDQLLDLPEYSNTDSRCKSEPISYEGKRYSEYKDKKDFKQANYIIITGRDDISKNNDQEIYNSTLKNNKFGKEIKVILGSPIAGEGLDMKRIREIHILDPWHHLNRLEQVIGRGIRNCSHNDLELKYRNCTIFFHVATGTVAGEYADELDRETIDIRVYRKGEHKSIKMGIIEKALKKNAIDCLLNKQGNIYSQEGWGQIIDIETSQKVNSTYKIGDKPYSRICNFQKECEYECEPTSKLILDKSEIDTDTYNINFAQPNIYKVIELIKKLYYKDFIYDLRDITEYCLVNGDNVEEMYVYTALDILLNNDNQFLKDKFNRIGNLIYKGGYYIFQPENILNKDIPLYYRNKPLMGQERRISLNKNYYFKELEEERKIIKEITTKKSYEYNDIVDNIYKNFFKDYKILIEDDFLVKQVEKEKNNKTKIEQVIYDYYVDRTIFSKKTILLYNLCLKLREIKEDKDFRKINDILNEKEYYIFKSLLNYFLFEGRDMNKKESKSPWKINGYRIFKNNEEIFVCFRQNRDELSCKDCSLFQIIRPFSIITGNNLEENKINGYIDNNDDQYFFKLVDKSNVNTKKIKKSTGAVCSQISSKESIGKIINKVTNMTKYNGKNFKNNGEKINKDKSFLCYYLELVLRYRELEKYNNLKWFYRTNEKK